MSPVTLNRFAARMKLAFTRILQNGQLNTQEVIQHYDGAVLPPNFDRNDRDTWPAAVPSVRDFQALVHFISDSTRGFGPEEFEIGDVILFCQPEQVLTGEAVWFDIQGDAYVQKEAGANLAKEWTVTIGGRLMHRTLLLTRRRG